MRISIKKIPLIIITIIILLCAQQSYCKQIFADDYVSDMQCASCHAREYKDWQTSHHALAMQEANAKTILGNFNNSYFKSHDVTTHFYKKNDKYYINTQNPNGKMVDYEVRYTFGVTPLQQYLVDFGAGRLQAFTIAWDVKNNKWFDLYSHEHITLNDPLHWTSRLFNWNHYCADCHSTHLKKNYSVISHHYQTTWTALNVGCQACHGPGAKHIALATNANQKELSNDNGLLINYKNKNNLQKVETCAACHSRRYAITEVNKPNEPLLNNYIPEILQQGLYYADGQILEEDYEYGSFLQSKMFQAGVFCADCHNPHTLKLNRQGNGVCLQCHSSSPPAKFISAPHQKNYDSPTHYFHTPNSRGAFCVDCHMPAKTYMQLDVRRNHNFSIPRPDLTIKYGIPNACNQCHQNKSPQWAQQKIEAWYGKKNYPLSFADTFTAARAGQSQAEVDLIKLVLQQTHPAIIRATAVALLKDYNDMNAKNNLILALKDPDPLVRTTAVMGLNKLSDKEKITYLMPLCDDPIRAVRMNAAHACAGIPVSLLNMQQQSNLKRALTEYKTAQLAQIDQPEGNINLGAMAAMQGESKSAEKYYQTAIALDPTFSPSHLQLALLYISQDQKEKAQQVLKTATDRNRKNGELFYYYGLLLAEMGKPQESITALAQATELLPENVNVWYNYGLMLQKNGDISRAEKALLTLINLDINNPRSLQAIIMLYAQQKQWDDAYRYAEKLYQLNPADISTKKLLDEIILQKTSGH